MTRARTMGMLLFVLAVSLGALLPKSARACKCISRLASGLADASDVPVNIVPLLRGVGDPTRLTWTTLAGEAVPFVVHANRGPHDCEDHAELRASSELEPETTYLIRAQRAGDTYDELRFTTGRGRVPEQPLPAPSLSVTLVNWLIKDSCVSPINGCIAVGETDTEVSVLDAQGGELHWFVIQGGRNFERIRGEVACIEARTRDAAGRRSEPVRLCGAELAVRDPLPSDYEDSYLTCRDGRIPSTAQAANLAADAGAEVTSTAEAARSAEAEGGDGCSVMGGEQDATMWSLCTLALCLRRLRSRARGASSAA